MWVTRVSKCFWVRRVGGSPGAGGTRRCWAHEKDGARLASWLGLAKRGVLVRGPGCPGLELEGQGGFRPIRRGNEGFATTSAPLPLPFWLPLPRPRRPPLLPCCVPLPLVVVGALCWPTWVPRPLPLFLPPLPLVPFPLPLPLPRPWCRGTPPPAVCAALWCGVVAELRVRLDIGGSRCGIRRRVETWISCCVLLWCGGSVWGVGLPYSSVRSYSAIAAQCLCQVSSPSFQLSQN